MGISPIAVTNDHFRYARIFLQSQHSIIFIWSKVHLHAAPTPSTGARRTTSGVSLQLPLPFLFPSPFGCVRMFLFIALIPIPSCGPHHIARDFFTQAVCIALTVTAKEDHRPSFEARSSGLLFCERAHDAINLFPCQRSFISCCWCAYGIVSFIFCRISELSCFKRTHVSQGTQPYGYLVRTETSVLCEFCKCVSFLTFFPVRAMIIYSPFRTSRPHYREKLPRLGTNSPYVFFRCARILDLSTCSFSFSCRVKGDPTPPTIRRASKTEHQESY
ncbi:hypothetical protein B0H10DRAFT_1156516 [Mycena sp. CBHHK59/15]|nr:hypothetical protein B0H10DRAFT_1156516 [Mycena sp. CBHHK59/15]